MRALCFFRYLALCCAALAAPAFSQPYGPPPYGDRAGVQPLDRLLPGIRRAHPGEFYDAEGPTYGPAGDPHYHLKWMTPDGRVIWFDTDARSGRVLRSSPGRDSFDNPNIPRRPPPGYGRPSFAGRFRLRRFRGGPPPPGYGGRMIAVMAAAATLAAAYGGPRLHAPLCADSAAGATVVAAADAAGAAGAGGTDGGHAMRILLVEDDKDLQRLLKKALGDAGYVVDTALRWRGRPFPGRHRTL